jgi:hypothetical protein
MSARTHSLKWHYNTYKIKQIEKIKIKDTIIFKKFGIVIFYKLKVSVITRAVSRGQNELIGNFKITPGDVISIRG